ncbi:MAG: hypothetical protein JNK66_00060 [Chitinophagales bacterium]|nr:hypothetical protein [Chitinophagales bacterium]
MNIDDSNWSYNEFLAFLLIYGAEMNAPLTSEELAYIQQRTNISDVLKIKSKVDSVSDAEALDVIDDYKKKFLNTAEAEAQARKDLHNLLDTPGMHSQLEKVVVHILERLI